MNKDWKKVVAGSICALMLFIISASPSPADAQLASYGHRLGATCSYLDFSYNPLSSY